MKNVQTLCDSRDGLPGILRPFFWDMDFGKLSVRADSYSIISRLLELGDETGVRFLFETYAPEEMISVLQRSRSISSRSRRFWTIILEADDSSCTPKRYPTPYGNCSRD